jgi:hypothetical protein
MSSALAKVRFLSDGKIMYGEYSGTADVYVSHLKHTLEEAYEEWKKLTWLNCSCGKDEPVIIANDYGGGTYWAGRACRHCRSIETNLSYEDIYENNQDHPICHGLPDWWHHD